jgi:N-acetylmuramoyl-L-alanine amidase
VATELKKLLETRGAKVLLTRDSGRPIALADRVAIIENSGAHAAVSIHLDAVPDGRNPMTMNGSATYGLSGSSLPLAGAVEWAIVRRLKSANRGVHQADFAVLRPTWMPSILCEGMTITRPQEEMAIGRASVRAAYALGIVEGLEKYFLALEDEARQL